MADASEQGLVAQLVGFAAGLIHATCRTLAPDRPCHTRGIDVYAEHLCQDARGLLARATPEAVRRADAAPELYEALNDVLELAEKWADGVGRSHPDHERTAGASAAIAKAEGRS